MTGQDPLCEPSWPRPRYRWHSQKTRLQSALSGRRSYAQRTIRNACASVRDRLPAPGDETPKRACAHACACDRHHPRRQARGRRALCQGRQGRCADASARAKEVILGGPTTRRSCCNCRASAPRICLRSLGIECGTRFPASARTAGPLRAAIGRPRQEHQDHQTNAGAA